PSWLLVGYGISTKLWSLTIMAGLIVASSLYWHGVGVILSALIVVSWLRPTLLRLGQTCRKLFALPKPLRSRVLVRGTFFVGAAIVLLVVTPWPFATTAPGVIEYSPLSVVRAESSGFVKQVLVEDGETVSEGQPLLELQNDDLERERHDLELAIEQSLHRERLANQQHDTAECQVEQQKREALHRRHAERQRQVERLTLKAPIAGVVICRQINTLLGSFSTQGRELLSVGDPRQREFVAVVSQEHLLAAQAASANSVLIHLHGRGPIPGRIERIHPRASKTPEHTCLCAPFGGPLPVQTLPSEESHRPPNANSFEFLQPHFRLNVSLDQHARDNPLAGELGWISFGHQRTCAGQMLWWLQQQLRTVQGEGTSLGS
ncbi:MAG TPA: efflux RND transporter periplasmic adaptor subunit, partial [Planctomycetaceae bacterium]|nr:efflux RND transporter periplasmic adaptor subunit [Planctomycetaceae bacterium]